jgi:predicted dehydrogenase
MSDESRTRREFIRSSAVAGGAVLATLRAPAVHAAGSDAIGVGLVGCGGRGRGAAADAVKSSPGVKVVAIGDAFADRVAETRERLKELGEAGAVPEERSYVGLDAYQRVIATPGVNYVILATPPGFRPLHLEAAVAAGKHVFTEKPVAVDGPGIRSVLATAEAAQAKGLGVGAGTQRRHEQGYVEAMKRVKDGGIGEIVSARAYWNQGALWNKPRQSSWSDLEWQMRNWLYFTWLSGDHIVEQHVHNLDVVNWAMGAHPVRAVGMGGRQSRISPDYGHCFDHFAVDYEYASGMHMLSMCRQIPDCANRVAETLVGTKGSCELESGAKRYEVLGWAASPPTPGRPSPGRRRSSRARRSCRGTSRSARCRCPRSRGPGRSRSRKRVARRRPCERAPRRATRVGTLYFIVARWATRFSRSASEILSGP